MTDINAILHELLQDPAKKQELADIIAKSSVATKPFLPQPKQQEAYYSQADIVLYGGQPGGGKSSLGVGYAMNEAVKALIVRQEFAHLTPLTTFCDKIARENNYGSLTGMGNRPIFRNGKQVIYFEGMDSGKIDGKQGRDVDYIYVDEAAQMPEMNVRMLFGWLRTDIEGQRTRMILGTNPPLNSVGDWLSVWFAPWLDDKHENPAKQGELRYFLPDGDGFRECDKDEVMIIQGKEVRPHSRTYISAALEDNRYINAGDYLSKLAVVGAQTRDILFSGNFMLARTDPTDQCIPTAWVRAAMDRWEKTPKPSHIPMCCIGADVAQGGADDCVLSPRYDWWFDELIRIAGSDCPDGATLAAQILARRRDGAHVAIDLGGGYGGSAYEILKNNGVTVHAHKGANAATRRTKDRQHSFVNMRSQVYWLLREALDPEQDGGSAICLPPDPRLLADLTIATYTVTARGIQVEPKESVVKRLKRSPDAGDAVTIAYSQGLTQANIQGGWKAYNAAMLPTTAGQLRHTPRR